jgi:predicted dehydrogenase
MTHSPFSRRSFLSTSAAMGVTAALAPRVACSAQTGANDRIRLGLIGMGGRMGQLYDSFANQKGVEIAAICDPDQQRIDAALERIAKKNKSSAAAPKTHQDMRHLLDDPNIDAVVIATCNHWHCLATIWACERGKHVYVEKPLGNNVWEEQQAMLAARKHGRIVQVGTQQRSDPMQEEIRKFLHDDRELGKAKYIVATRIGAREPIGKRSDPLDPPKSVDYNLWVGPARVEPLYRDNLHYDWHWDWNTGAGEMGNWGVHILDDVRNVGLNNTVAMPTSVIAGGGRVLWDDAGDTPNVHFAAYTTTEIPVLFALSNLKQAPAKGLGIGNRSAGSGYAVVCEGGVLAGQRAGATAFDAEGKTIRKFSGNSGNGLHQQNFINAVRHAKREDLAAEIEVGHHSSSWCHLANVACRAGHEMKASETWGGVMDDAPAAELLDSMKTYLASLGVAIEEGKVTASPRLPFDVNSGRFTGEHAEAANKFLTREYRKGFKIFEQTTA